MRVGSARNVAAHFAAACASSGLGDDLPNNLAKATELLKQL
jgi:hypothetical protein